MFISFNQVQPNISLFLGRGLECIGQVLGDLADLPDTILPAEQTEGTASSQWTTSDVMADVLVEAASGSL